MDSPCAINAWMRVPIFCFSSLKRSFGMYVGRLMNPLRVRDEWRCQLNELVGKTDHANASKHDEEQPSQDAEQGNQANHDRHIE